jgi:hypothetical protein
MIEPVGDEFTMWVLPDGDFVHGAVLAVDTYRWTLEDFKRFDGCPAGERVGLAQMIDAIRKAEGMSVVEVSLKRGNTPRW